MANALVTYLVSADCPGERQNPSGKLEMQLQRFKDGIDAACALPTSKGVVDRTPWAETFLEYPKNAIEHLAWLASRASAYALICKQGLDEPPLCIGQLIATGHCISLKLSRRCEFISSSGVVAQIDAA